MFSRNSYKNGVHVCNLHKDCNILTQVLRIFPRNAWDIQSLSRNPNITWDFVKENLSSSKALTWDWRGLSCNPAITWENVLSEPNIPWDWVGLSSNPNITWEIVRTNPGYAWDWGKLSANPSVVNTEILEKYPGYPWNWRFVSYNPNLTLDFIEKHLDYAWAWGAIAKNGRIVDFDYVKSHPEIKWNWKSLSHNPNVTLEIIQQNLDKKWDWEYLPQNPGLTLKDIQSTAEDSDAECYAESNPNFPWNWINAIDNPNITWEMVKENGWEDDPCVCARPNFTIENLEECTCPDEFQWRICFNPNLSLTHILGGWKDALLYNHKYFEAVCFNRFLCDQTVSNRITRNKRDFRKYITEFKKNIGIIDRGIKEGKFPLEDPNEEEE